ncbi:MAG TPA: GWxTD domain-containing protein, partial [Terriglobales bacterium]|nr:GWxTD domain-containing protein [Terriglobales bacterium]
RSRAFMLIRRVLGVVLTGFLVTGAIVAQDSNTKAGASSQSQAAPQETDPLKRPLTEKQKKQNAKALQKEIGKTYRKWLDEDVRWIITDEERTAFKQLSNDEERDQFIEQFWLRRDPTPDTVENEYKEEHYRRIAYANEHFASGIPGWRTDRGRIYIMYGPADSMESHPSGGGYQRTPQEGGGTTATFPFEVWRYRYLEGVGQEILIEFVDPCMCGEYHMTMDPNEKDALLHVPGAGLTMLEQEGLANKAARMAPLGAGDPTNPFDQMGGSKAFDRLQQFAALQRPPAVKFKDLEEVVSHKLSYNLLPFDVITDFIKVTSDTTLVPITVQVKNKDITFVAKDGVQTGVVNIFGRLTTLTGRIAQTFEDTVTVQTPSELLPKEQEKPSVYWKALPLRPGRYRLDLVLKDVNGDRVGSWSRGIMVPEFSDDRLAVSSLILADDMEKVPTKNVGTGSFVIGNTRVRPRVPDAGKPASFKRNQRVNFWMQVYNLGIDQQTHKPSATVEYEITNLANHKAIVHAVESTLQMGNVGDQLTLTKSLPLAEVEPGQYQVTIKVDDKISKQSIAPTATFMVE